MEVVMEGMLFKCINSLTDMEFLKKLVKLIRLKTQLYLVAQRFKIAWIVLLQKEENQEIKVTVGHNRNIQYGKQLNLA